MAAVAACAANTVDDGTIQTVGPQRQARVYGRRVLRPVGGGRGGGKLLLEPSDAAVEMMGTNGQGVRNAARACNGAGRGAVLGRAVRRTRCDGLRGERRAVSRVEGCDWLGPAMQDSEAAS